MPTKKKTDSKSVSSEKQVLQKTVQSKKPSAKTISSTTKQSISKNVPLLPEKRILTAEGWKRMMLRNRKTTKPKS